MIDKLKEGFVYVMTFLTLFALAMIPIFLGSIPGWAQQCVEDTQVARLSSAMLGSVPTASEYCGSCSGSCIYCEDFEGTTDCGDDTDDNNCRYTYTDTIGAGGTADAGNTFTTSLCSSLATKDLILTATNNQVLLSTSIGTNSTIYAKGYFKVNTPPTLASGTYDDVTGVGNNWVVRVMVKRNAAGTGVADQYAFAHTNNAASLVYWDTGVAIDSNWHQFKLKAVSNCSSSCDNTKIVFYLDGTEYTPAGSDYTTRNATSTSWGYWSVPTTSSIEFDNVMVRTDTYPTCTGE